MCGIIGIASDEEVPSKWTLERLKRLEYRGYDSYGYFDGNNLLKEIGSIKIPEESHPVKQAILHTRWATHGCVTVENAHPHQSENGEITIVHNGIIENYEELRTSMISKGHVFKSQTDSEVIAHYFEDKIKTESMKEACIDFFHDIKGEFATIIMRANDTNLYALKRDSPLVLGILPKKIILASDIYAFSDETNKAIFFDNNEFAIVDGKTYEFFDQYGNDKLKPIQEFKWDEEDETKQTFDHYMLKEIHEEPNAVSRLLASLEAEQKEAMQKLVAMMKHAKKIVFAACGTSYHASLVGVSYLHQAGINAQALIGSEFRNFAFIDSETLVIFVSQSGETMDLIDAIKYAKEKHAYVACVVNVPYSTIQRESEISLNVCAGQEVCVAATKSFINQVALFLCLAQSFGYSSEIDKLPKLIQETLALEKGIQDIAKRIAYKLDMYVLGRGTSYPIAREIALKIKEIDYIHAEGMMGGELKHGTIALIEKGTPVIGLIDGNDTSMESNMKEVKARGAMTITISNNDADIKLPKSPEGTFGILAAIAGQLLSYHIGKEKGLEIDKPRNLAKSVTVR